MSACALVRDRLRAHGGVAVTGERPIELPLEGSHGQGICFQTSMPAEPRHFAGAFRQLLGLAGHERGAVQLHHRMGIQGLAVVGSHRRQQMGFPATRRPVQSRGDSRPAGPGRQSRLSGDRRSGAARAEMSDQLRAVFRVAASRHGLQGHDDVSL